MTRLEKIKRRQRRRNDPYVALLICVVEEFIENYGELGCESFAWLVGEDDEDQQDFLEAMEDGA